MARAWVAAGGSSSRMILDSTYVESINIEDSTGDGVWSIGITMISGAKYTGFFESEQARDLFVMTWRGEFPVAMLDMEAVTEEVNDGIQ